jgi:hypothetical protein
MRFRFFGGLNAQQFLVCVLGERVVGTVCFFDKPYGTEGPSGIRLDCFDETIAVEICGLSEVRRVM